MMTSPAEQEYWSEFLRRLDDTSLAELAAEYGAAPEDLEAALARTTGDRPVQQEAWWTEVLRRQEQGSLRELARRFGTNPRRLRRGLARAAVRVGGEAVAEAGLPGFEPIRDRLGKEPDRTLAAEIGVTVEAIKGERRRLGVEPYRMRPDAEEWGEKTFPARDKPRPRRRWQDAPEPEVIRRAAGGAGSVAAPAVEPPPLVVTRTAFRRMARSPEGEDGGIAAVVPPTFSGLVPSATRVVEGAASEAAGAAERRRRRIVRPSHPEPDDLPSASTAARLPRVKASGMVRVIRATEGPEEGVEGAPKAHLEAAVVPPTPAPRASVRRRPPAPVGPEAVPTVPAHEDPLDLDLPPEADAEAPASPREQRKVIPAMPSEGTYAWQVEVPGHEQPLLVVADDIAGALRLASERLGSKVVAEARAWRVGAVLHDEEEP